MFLLRVANMQLSVSLFLQTAIVPASLRVYVFLLMKVVETPRRISRYRAASASVKSIFPELLSISMAKKAIACLSSCFGMTLFNTKSAEIMDRGFAVMLS